MTKIEWADRTINPIIGCSKVSPGCDNCYAERMACRLALNPQTPQYQDVTSLDGKSWNGKTRLVESALEQPLTWRKGCRIFVGSMTDLFHRETPDEWLDRIFAVMALCQQHTFLLLTKRPDGMREYITSRVQKPAFTGVNFAYLMGAPSGSTGAPAHVPWPLPNVWLGVTAENQAMFDYRAPILLDTPAAKRFVSVEPMLGAVDCGELLSPPEMTGVSYGGLHEYVGGAPLVDWIICGSESGPGARPIDIEWARSLKDQCVEAGVPFFYKQGPGDDGRVTKMSILDGRVWDQRP